MIDFYIKITKNSMFTIGLITNLMICEKNYLLCWIVPKKNKGFISFFRISNLYWFSAFTRFSSTVARWSVGPLVRRSLMFVKKWSLEYQKVNKTYLPTYLWYSSYSSDSSDSCDSRDSNDSSDSSDSSYQTTFRLNFFDLFLWEKGLPLTFTWSSL